jgi:hypothetical protein
VAEYISYSLNAGGGRGRGQAGVGRVGGLDLAVEERGRLDAVPPERLQHPEVHVGLEGLLVLAVEHVRASPHVEGHVVVQDDLLRDDRHGLSHVDVRAREARLADDLRGELRVLVHADVEVHGGLHLQSAVVAAGGDVREDLVVGDGDRVVIEREHLHAAEADLDDVAVLPRVFDPVADLEGAVEHDGDPGDEGGHEVAHGEADGERQRAADHGERRGIEADAEAQADADGGDVDGEASGRLDLLDGGAAVGEAAGEALREVLDDPEGDDGAHDDWHAQRDAAPADELGELADVGGVLGGGGPRGEEDQRGGGAGEERGARELWTALGVHRRPLLHRLFLHGLTSR